MSTEASKNTTNQLDVEGAAQGETNALLLMHFFFFFFSEILNCLQRLYMILNLTLMITVLLNKMLIILLVNVLNIGLHLFF